MASLIFTSALASSVLVSEFFRHGFVLAVLSRRVLGRGKSCNVAKTTASWS